MTTPGYVASLDGSPGKLSALKPSRAVWIGVLAIVILLVGGWFVFAPPDPEDTKRDWMITIESGSVKQTVPFRIPSHRGDTERAIDGVLRKYWQTLQGKTSSRITLWRTEQDPEAEARMLKQHEGKNLDISATTTYSTGPYHVEQRPDGKFQLFLQDSSGKPQNYVDGAEDLDQIIRSASFYIGARLEDGGHIDRVR